MIDDFTQPYDLVVEALMDQMKGGTIFLRPLSERPSFQRRYVWTNVLASRLIESILLNVPIPPCYLSQNEEFELDVIDGQQRLFSLTPLLPASLGSYRRTVPIGRGSEVLDPSGD